MRNIHALIALAAMVVAACSPAAETPARAVLVTDIGNIVIELETEAAPASSEAFLNWVDEGRFNRDVAGFYRIVNHDNDNGEPLINIIQGGLIAVPADVDGVTHESTAQTGLANTAGTLALARGDIGTASPAYFFINVTDNPGLDHGALRNPDGQGFAVFGRVVEGMDVVEAIHQRASDGEADSEYLAGQILSEPVRFNATRP